MTGVSSENISSSVIVDASVGGEMEEVKDVDGFSSNQLRKSEGSDVIAIVVGDNSPTLEGAVICVVCSLSPKFRSSKPNPSIENEGLSLSPSIFMSDGFIADELLDEKSLLSPKMSSNVDMIKIFLRRSWNFIRNCHVSGFYPDSFLVQQIARTSIFLFT